MEQEKPQKSFHKAAMPMALASPTCFAINGKQEIARHQCKLKGSLVFTGGKIGDSLLQLFSMLYIDANFCNEQ